MAVQIRSCVPTLLASAAVAPRTVNSDIRRFHHRPRSLTLPPLGRSVPAGTNCTGLKSSCSVGSQFVYCSSRRHFDYCFVQRCGRACLNCCRAWHARAFSSSWLGKLSSEERESEIDDPCSLSTRDQEPRRLANPNDFESHQRQPRSSKPRSPKPRCP